MLGSSHPDEQRRVDICHKHRTRRTDALGHPPSNRPAAAPDLQAPHPRGDTDSVEISERHRVEQRLGCRETALLSGALLLEPVP
jgi:hypothetical protein